MEIVLETNILKLYLTFYCLFRVIINVTDICVVVSQMKMRSIYRRGILLSLVTVITLIFLLKTHSNVTRIETTVPVPDIFKNEPLPILSLREDEVSHILRIAQSITQKPILVSLINDAYLPLAYNWLCNTEPTGVHAQVLCNYISE